LTALLANKNQLHSEIDKLNNIHSGTSQGLDECRSRLASTELQLESANAELAKIRTSFTVLESEHISMTTSLSETKSELTAVSGDRERLREAHARDRAENDQLRKRVESSKKCIAALRER
jgi:chromosome segregation ATPase